MSHRRPIALLLEVGIKQDELARYQKIFDATSPLPPADAWKAEQDSD